jgi:hypothetical protein
VIFKGNTAAAVRTPDETGYIVEWKLPLKSIAGNIPNKRSRSQFFGLEWPLFVPADGKVISFDADITDRDDSDGPRDANRFLRLGDQPALWRDSKSWSMRGAITLTNEKVPVSNEDEIAISDLPKSPLLKQNYPNPFNPSTNIAYSLPKSAHVKMSVYNMLGKRVSTLVNRNQKAGKHLVNFDASNLASGVYLYRLETGGFAQTNKMILIK